MKRLTAIFMSFILTLGSSMFVYASDMTVGGEQSSYSFDFEEGKTFDINFVISGNSKGFNNATYRVKYDPDVIQAVNTADYTAEDGYVGTLNDYGFKQVFIPASLINSQLALVPSTSNDDYEGMADGKKTASEIGIVKLAAITGIDPSDSTKLSVINTDGKLMKMTFKMVGSGSTDVEFITQDNGFTFYDTDGNGLDVTYNDIRVELKSKNTDNSNTSTGTGSAGSGSSSEETTQDTTVTADNSVEETTVIIDSVVVDNSTEITFTDIANYPWAQKAINDLANKKIVSGVGNGLFNPSANVKRADFLLMLVNALGFEGDGANNFKDVPQDKYYAKAVGIAKELGIASGSGDGNFYPESFITRQDMMVLANKALSLKTEVQKADASVLDKFADKDTISSYAVDSLSSMVQAGIVSGTNKGVEPKANTTRAQSAVIIYNILNQIQ